MKKLFEERWAQADALTTYGANIHIAEIPPHGDVVLGMTRKRRRKG